MTERDFASAWAEITHQRYVLRRLAQQRTLELLELAQVARRLRALGGRVGAHQLVSVASAILGWSELAKRSEAREQAGALLLELSDSLDRLCMSRANAGKSNAALELQ